jgi:DNA-binding beta-propeller fold protein YncE
MTKEIPITKNEAVTFFSGFCYWDSFRHLSFVIRHSAPLLAIYAALVGLSGCAPTKSFETPPPAQLSAHRYLPGKQNDGSVLLPNQWSLRPAGIQIDMGDFPVNIAVHPGGRFAAVLHSGYERHEIRIVDIATARVVSSKELNQTFYGIEFSHDGRRLFCSGAGDEVIHAFTFENGILSEHDKIRLHTVQQRCVPAGLAVNARTSILYVANVWGDRVTRVMLPAPGGVQDLPIGTNMLTTFGVPFEAPRDFETAAATKRVETSLYNVKPEDTFPYACRLDEKRQRLYVSLWAQASVAVIDLTSDKTLSLWPTEEHPCEMALTRSGRFLFVANASRNTVTVLNTESGKAIETIHAALYPNAPNGSTPNSVALSPDERTLFIANADNNMIAVFDVSHAGKSRSLGFIPVGWYPTSVRVTPDGKRLLVANGKGLTSRPNPLGPQPGVLNGTNTMAQYIGRLFPGTFSIIDISGDEFKKRLSDYTAQAYRCSPLRADTSASAARPPSNPVPLRPGENSPIQYCIYIIKENRTYDQVLGDIPEGNGDPALCLFPEAVTPNHHKLAREFVLLDNFYVDAEVSADGHEWTMGAYATDFVEKTWPLSYGHNHPTKYPYPAEGNFSVASPAVGYLWDRAREAGVSYRSYGEFIDPHGSGKPPFLTRIKTLQGHIDEYYYGWNLNYPDAKRADRFIAELKRFEVEGGMPRLQILRLPNDHTHGATAGELAPKAYLADNDLALGRIVEAVSHSKFWSQTAIFVLEDDAQNGPDHVDAHRSIAFAISPYTRHRKVDSTMYSTSSMLRTMELILGLKPMSQFDAAAAPMFNAFKPEPDLGTYEALASNVDLNERNKKTAWGSGFNLNFAREDAIDDLLLNEIIWRSVRGNETLMPPPKRAAFVFSHSAKDED